MRRQWYTIGRAQRVDLQKSRNAETARRISLQYVDRFRFQHLAEVKQVVAIFARCNAHSAWHAFAKQSQPFEIVARHWLLEPGDIVVGDALGHRGRLLAVVAAVGVDKEPDIADCIAHGGNSLRVGDRVASDLHLYPAHPIIGAAAELPPETRYRIVGEAAAAVERDAITCRPEQRSNWLPQQLALQIPQRGVDSRDCRCDEAGATEIARVL